MSTYHPSNEFDTPTPMPKHPCPCNEPLKDNFTIALTNQASPQPYSPPLIDPCITRKDYKDEYKKMKAKLALLEANPSTSQTSKTFQPKNKGLVVETFDWNKEEVSDDEEVTHVKNNSKTRKRYEKCLTSSKKVSQCINEAIPHQKKKVLGGKLFIESSSKMNENENLFVPASMRSLRPKPIQKPQLKCGLCLYTNHSTDDWYRVLYCMICKREDHRTSDHEMYTALLRRSKNYKAWPYQYASLSKQQLKAKAKLFPPCTHCGFNDHKFNDCINYPECGIFESYDHFTLGHNRVIHIRGGVLAESAQSSESSIGVKCNTRRSTVLSTTNHNEFDHFKIGEKIQATKDKEPTKKWVHKRNKPKFIICVETNQGAYLYLDSGCLRSMTGVMSYLHKYVEQTGPKVVFGDNSSCITGGYDSINYGGSTIELHSKLNKTSLSGSVCISFIWIYLDQKKSQALEMIMSFIRIVENQNDVKVKQIRTDNGTEFKNHELESFYDEKGISQNFTYPYTLKQNGIAERKNRTVIEAARTMLNGSVLEFLIKFSVLNWQRPLTLDLNIFCSSTGLDYNNGKYVALPTPKVVKKELSKIAINSSYLDKTLVLKNSFPVAWRFLFTFVIQVDIGEIIYSDLVTKLLNKSMLKYVSYPRFISGALQVLLDCDLHSGWPEASESLPQKRKNPQSKKSPKETKATLPLKPTKGSKQSHSFSLGTVPDLQDQRETYKSLVLDCLPHSRRALINHNLFLRAFLLFEDELAQESDEEEVLAAGDDVEEDTQADEKED
nr:retrovirus-related Pol polyprotein from transposon TNT 1-94 [Tanacetum cinerariifolium]